MLSCQRIEAIRDSFQFNVMSFAASDKNGFDQTIDVGVLGSEGVDWALGGAEVLPKLYKLDI